MDEIVYLPPWLWNFIIDGDFFFREIVLGEHNTRKDPDCPECPKVVRQKIDSSNIILHEGFPSEGPSEVSAEAYRNDIALIRLNEPAVLYSEDPTKSILGMYLYYDSIGH